MPGLTKETFLSLRQTFRGITGLAKYLINYCGFKYVLLGKIQSDTIEQWFSTRVPPERSRGYASAHSNPRVYFIIVLYAYCLNRQ